MVLPERAQADCFLDTVETVGLDSLLTQMPTFPCRYRAFILLITFLIYTCYPILFFSLILVSEENTSLLYKGGTFIEVLHPRDSFDLSPFYIIFSLLSLM